MYVYKCLLESHQDKEVVMRKSDACVLREVALPHPMILIRFLRLSLFVKFVVAAVSET